MNEDKLKEILRRHELWVRDEDDGEQADLRGADLCNANLCDANLCDADLCNANLRNANLRNANLCGVDLYNANLCGANLCGADLCGADLCEANLGNLHIYQLSRIGSDNRMTTFWADENKVWCGCFVGTFAEWRNKIRETYSDEICDECPEKVKYRKQYEAALAYFAELAAIDRMPQYKELLEGAK